MVHTDIKSHLCLESTGYRFFFTTTTTTGICYRENSVIGLLLTVLNMLKQRLNTLFTMLIETRLESQRKHLQYNNGIL